MADRNPYLILGIDFATPSDSARRAFARAARRLRKEGGAWEVEDLNWALHEIESVESHPADLVSIYRVPADSTAFQPAGEGLFRPRPVPLERKTGPSDGEVILSVREAALKEADQLLLGALDAIGLQLEAPYPITEEQREN